MLQHVGLAMEGLCVFVVGGCVAACGMGYGGPMCICSRGLCCSMWDWLMAMEGLCTLCCGVRDGLWRAYVHV